MWKYGSLTISPFNWMEASYFYYRPSDLPWIDGIKGHELDKGFNIKLTHRINNSTSFAVGLDDFAGTGYFSKEYFVAKKTFSNLSLTTGLGWGKFNGISGFKNPFIISPCATNSGL